MAKERYSFVERRLARSIRTISPLLQAPAREKLFFAHAAVANRFPLRRLRSSSEAVAQGKDELPSPIGIVSQNETYFYINK